MKKITLILTVVFGLFSTQANAFNIFHPIRSAEKVLVVGAVGYVASQATANYLIAHPETIGNWLSTHPNEIESLTKYVDKKIDTAKTPEEYNKYNNLKQQLALDNNVNQSQAIQLENDPLWKNLEGIVEDEIRMVDISIAQNNKMPYSCNIGVVAQILEPVDVFNQGVGIVLPEIKNTPTSILNVNSYFNLKKGYRSSSAITKLTHDHIPSYGALYQFFKSHGMPLPTVRKDSNLESNSSAISIPIQLHLDGSRTFGGRNTKKDVNDDTLMVQDASDLLAATKKDIATMAYMFQSYPQYGVGSLDYIKSAMTVYERNKLLCMYDVKYIKQVK